MVAKRAEEPGVRLSRLLLGRGRGDEYGGVAADHCDDGDDLLQTTFAEFHRFDDGPSEHGVHGQPGELAAEVGQVSRRVERLEPVEQFQCADERGFRGRVHEVEREWVLDVHRLELEHDRREVCTLYLRLRDVLQAHECVLGEEPVTFAGSFATCTSRPLPGLGLGDGQDLQEVRAEAGVVGPGLDKARVHDVPDAGDGDRRFGDVGRQDAFPVAFGNGREREQLFVGRQRRIHRHHVELRSLESRRLPVVDVHLVLLEPGVAEVGVRQGLDPLVDQSVRHLDFVLSCQEPENIPLVLVVVQLNNGGHQCVEVTLLRLGEVKHVHLVLPALDVNRLGAGKEPLVPLDV